MQSNTVNHFNISTIAYISNIVCLILNVAFNYLVISYSNKRFQRYVDISIKLIWLIEYSVHEQLINLQNETIPTNTNKMKIFLFELQI